ncbi:SDR family NAD(P)-dependent oxidoreductase [Altererythrobacter sp. BO-6]|uniref:SDR family NAD(P)-dependent oxidoreductase n=1 Tax=Altererythrobacter sp. BO-6 TaxID=2604537 RepID=UPI0013E15C21|nr:SDR family NAD(P)-dependent oxidoreductase [Altererythrobacter sp. BO-6]QIG52834.1 SDR family NAD(P)-dependent oxidoreductase [Altererythrobacter sp. BO-6]
MSDVGQSDGNWPRCAAVFGASGGIGAALVRALAERGVGTIYAGSRSGAVPGGPGVRPFRFDLIDEASIAAAAQAMRDTPPDLVIVASGVLTLPDGTGPEKSLKQIDGEAMARVFALNTIGPALVAKHMLSLLPRGGRSVFAALSARVGSISDNRLGGWHSYRASKAALNMLVRNFAIELGRTHGEAVVMGLHPGTVDSALSAPFHSGLPEGQLTAPEDAAANLLGVLDGLLPEQSGKVFDWQGEEVPA